MLPDRRGDQRRGMTPATAPTTTRPLMYQKARALGDVAAYGAGLQLVTPGKQRAYLALSPTELAIYFDEPDLALHYDLEGRLVKVAGTDGFQRRSLSHRVLVTRKTPTGIERHTLPATAADELVADACRRLWPLHEALTDDAATIEFAKPAPNAARRTILPVLERAANFDVAAAQRDVLEFSNVYGRVGILPPDQYNALVLQATEGCAYAGCLFCELYRGDFFHRKTPAEFAKHVRAAMAYHGAALRARRSIFLGEANALTVPQPDLLAMFDVLHEHFELPAAETETVPASWWLGSKTKFDGVSSFMDVFMGPARSVEEFAGLRQRGLRRVYLGMETGSDELLKWLCKPASAEQIERTARTLKTAGIAVGAIVLLGPGGQAFAESHVRETVCVLNALELGARDFIYFSPLVIAPCSRYAEQTGALNVAPLAPSEMDAQEAAIRAGLRFDEKRGRPYLARYEVEHFVY